MGNTYIDTARQVSFDSRGTTLRSENVQDAMEELAKVYPYNLNLLDNWYFTGGGSQLDGGQFPINQRGQPIYNSTSSTTYTIDRWKQKRTEVALLEDGIKLTTKVQSGDLGGHFVQPIEFSRTYLIGKVVTLSALIDNELISLTCPFPEISSSDTYPNFGAYQSFNKGVIGIENRISNPTSEVSIRVNIPVETFITIKAVKLELGETQTLARKEGDTWVLNDPPPNYALELAKCQRYYMSLSGKTGSNLSFVGVGMILDTTHAILFVPTPTTMRVNPDASMSGAYVVSGDHFGEQSYPCNKIIVQDSGDNGIYVNVSGTFNTKDVGNVAILQLRSGDSCINLDANL